MFETTVMVSREELVQELLDAARQKAVNGEADPSNSTADLVERLLEEKARKDSSFDFSQSQDDSVISLSASRNEPFQARSSKGSSVPPGGRHTAGRASQSTKTSQPIRRPPLASHDSEDRLPLEERAEIWAAQHKRLLDQRTQKKMELEEAEMKECTFKPSGSKESAFRETLDDRFERLHHEADQRTKIREKAKNLLEQAEVQDLTFKPKINDGTYEKEINLVIIVMINFNFVFENFSCR